MFFSLLGVILMLALTACTAGSSSAGQSEGPAMPEGSINLIDAAGLDNTAVLHILTLNTSGETGSEPYQTLTTITDPNILSAISSSLDVDTGFQLENLCIADYVLHFELADGTIHEFDYGCGAGAFLRGKQDFLPHPVVDPPEQFITLISEQIDAAKMAAIPEQINLVQEAHLSTTVAVEILEQHITDNGDGTSSAGIVPVLRVDDTDTVADLVETLNISQPTGPLVRCPASHTIVFELTDGSTQTMGYYCEGSPELLRWGDVDYTIPAPPSFTALMHDLLFEE